ARPARGGAGVAAGHATRRARARRSIAAGAVAAGAVAATRSVAAGAAARALRLAVAAPHPPRDRRREREHDRQRDHVGATHTRILPVRSCGARVALSSGCIASGVFHTVVSVRSGGRVSTPMLRGVGSLVGSLVISLVALGGTARAQVLNGSFESGDFTGWEALGATSVVSASAGVQPTDGTFQASIATGTGAVPAAEIEAFAGLPAGALAAVSDHSATE